MVVVDDHAAVPAALADALAAHPRVHVVGTASDVDSGVATVLEMQPHVVLMDVRMPGGGGAEAARRIRDLDPAARILALSAHEDRGSIVEMLAAGAVGYVIKGGHLDELVAAIERAAEGGMPLSDRVGDTVTAELAERLSWEDHSRRRTERHRDLVLEVLAGGIAPVYQPILDLRAGAVIGLEALARFPAHGGLTPKMCFARAAELDLGPRLEAAAMTAALDGAGQRPPSVYLAVNVSPEGLQSDVVREGLAERDLSSVVIELTEHAPVEDYPALARALQPLRHRGARVAVDDAGSGYASLRHILRLAPDFIKLDIELTAGVDLEPAKRALATALVQFAGEIGAVPIAEGVETAGELATLRRLGIDFAQGYALGRPGPLETALTASSGTAADGG